MLNPRSRMHPHRSWLARFEAQTPFESAHGDEAGFDAGKSDAVVSERRNYGSAGVKRSNRRLADKWLRNVRPEPTGKAC